MLTRDDLIDLIVSQIKLRPAPPPSSAGSPRPRPKGPEGPAGRIFLSEHDIKKALKDGSKELRVPAKAIVSPLASDWLTLRGVRIVRE